MGFYTGYMGSWFREGYTTPKVGLGSIGFRVYRDSRGILPQSDRSKMEKNMKVKWQLLHMTEGYAEGKVGA